MGSEDDPPGLPSAREGVSGVPSCLSETPRYEQQGAEMVRCERLANGLLKRIAVTNFSARIVRDLILDDDAEQRRELSIEAELRGQRLAFGVPAAAFGRMDWVLQQLGPQAIIYPGQQQHARAAIQWLSGPIPQERVFTHLGWRKHGAEWVYLHAGGAIGSEGGRRDVRVELPASLTHYRIQSPADRPQQLSAVHASLGCLSVAPDRVSFPLLAAVYRAPLGKVDFSLFLTGKTGVFKTALAALCQQHFGAAMDASRLPTSFSSTAPALQWLIFHAKDALLVVDDFAPTGRSTDSQLQSVAERLFRSAGNQQGRNRMGGDGRLTVPQPPRALVLATGEEVPPGQSIRARQLIVELGSGEVDRAQLSECQRAGNQGQFSAAMGAYISWIARHHQELQERLQIRVRDLRSRGYGRALHARLPSALAELQTGWELFLEFAVEIGAIDKPEQKDLEQRFKQALGELGVRQAKYHSCDPALRFMALVRAALMGGGAHVADRQGSVPDEPGRCGWKCKGRKWLPQGTRIGWIAGQDLFLEPTSSYYVAQQLAGTEQLAVSQQTLRYRLKERGLLVSTDAGRQMLTVRRTLEGCPRQVLHLRARDLVEFGARSVDDQMA
jgi:hypothetical protein